MTGLQVKYKRNPGYPPLVQVMFTMGQKNPVPKTFSSGSYIAQRRNITTMEGQFDLTLFLSESNANTSLQGKWLYNGELFEAATIANMAEHFRVLLEGIVNNAEQPINRLPLLTAKETQQLISWNQTETDYPKDKTIVDLFEQQVEKTPNAIAVVFEEQSLTYRQLNEQANQLAHYLLSLKTQNGGVLLSNNPLVAIAVERSLEMIIGLLAILKAGGAYVPIDPDYPAARIGYMLADSAAPLLLTQSHLVQQLALAELEHKCVVLCLDEMDVTHQSNHNPKVNTQTQDLAYVIYTSGSTGKPKGVMIENKGLINLALAQINTFHIDSESRILQFASFSFDASISEITTALLTGASLYIVAKEILLNVVRFTELMVQQQISHVTLPPSFLSILSDRIFSGLKTLVVAGEACSSELIKQWSNKVRFLNAYGPTENTICASIAVCFSEMDIPHIGQPIDNTRIYILDAQYKLQPIGITGELCIAGAGLARGYLNQPELTAEKFIEVELFGKPERIYKTGDLARWLPDGNLEYLGRIDHQIKLRGFRIELGEIEATLSQHPAIKEAVVSLYEADGNKRLIAYVVENREQKIEYKELRDWLKARLPDYMLPSSFVTLERLPLTPNGKIDRKALPAPEVTASSDFSYPVTSTEDLLATLWAKLLNREAIGRHDNFFELGGHSLLATQLIARIRESFKVELAIRAVFEHPELSTLATAIDAASGGFILPAIDKQAADTAKVLSFAQQRLWFLNQFEDEDSATYNMPLALQIAGDLNIEALRQSLYYLLERHESLRSYFPVVEGQAQVKTHTVDEIAILPIHDLQHISPETQQQEVRQQANAHALGVCRS